MKKSELKSLIKGMLVEESLVEEASTLSAIGIDGPLIKKIHSGISDYVWKPKANAKYAESTTKSEFTVNMKKNGNKVGIAIKKDGSVDVITPDDAEYVKAGYSGGMSNMYARNDAMNIRYSQNMYNWEARAYTKDAEGEIDKTIFSAGGPTKGMKGESLKPIILRNL